MFFEFLIWGSIFVFIYVERRGALQASRRMAAAHVARTRAQRHTLQSRLQALQARVEPQFLFNTLSQVRNLYDEDPARGARMLSDLIAYLRAALPRLRESGSTLAQEVQLATAYLRIVRARPDDPVLDIDIPRDALAARVPAMVLLPIIDHLLTASTSARDGSAAIRVAARASEGRLRVELTFDGLNLGPEREAVPGDIRDRMHELYGERGRLRLERSGSGTRVLMELPLEAADGDPR
jgi:LytS/YehU family sensor histidine kinase